MSQALGRRCAAALRAAAPLLLLAAAAGVLLQSPPASNNFYPQCPLYSLLHVQCPGCGGTRALAALLRGELRGAFHVNALITLMLPLVAGYGSVCYWRFVQHTPLHLPQIPRTALYAALAIAAAFTVQRNLPMYW
jgi:hypothetical protein